MKKIYFIVLSVLIPTFSANAQQWEWVRQISGSANDTGYSTDIDELGNVFVIGRCKGATTFEDETDPIGPLTYGDSDAFISKYDKDGNLIWATIAGSVPAGYDLAQGLAVDNEGGCYVTGFFNHESTFGEDVLVSNGFRDVFVSHINADGTFDWTNGFGGTAEDNGYGITVDNDGNILFCGRVNGVVNVEGTEIGTAGQFNAYIGKYNPDGDLIEIHDFKSPYRNVARRIAVDENGDIYICGGLNGYYTFQETLFSSEHSPAWDDAYLIKCQPDYTPIWFQSGGGNWFDMALDVDVSGTSVYLSGTYGGTATFDTITRTFNSDAEGTAAINAAKDLFVASYDRTSGDIKWLVDGGNEGLDEAQGVRVSANESVYFSGFFRDSISFEDTTLYSGGLSTTNILVAKLDSMGNLIWAKETGNNYENRGTELNIDQYENIYMAGDFNQPISFDGLGFTPSDRDAFGGKLTQHPSPKYTINGSSFCEGDTIIISLSGLTSPLTYEFVTEDTYTYWTDSLHIYYLASESPEMHLTGTISASNNIYTDELVLDTIIDVHAVPVDFLPSDSTSCVPVTLTVEEGYESYNWNDGLSLTNELTIEASGLYYLTITTAEGCISMDTITVTIDTDVALTIPEDTLACDELTYIASDEFATYDWNDGLDTDNEITITSSGTYILTVTNDEGCFGKDTMEVEIIALNPALPSDTIICDDTPFIISTDEGFTSYSWAPDGEETNEITVSTSNTYTVTVTDENGCEGSNSITVTFTDCSSIEEYTNTTVELVHIGQTNSLINSSDHNLKDIRIVGVNGRMVLTVNNLNSGETHALPELIPAVYFVSYTLDNGVIKGHKIIITK